MTTQFLQFIAHHWILFLALTIVIILLIFEESKDSLGGSKISLQDATMLVNHKRGVWIDLRNAADFSQGHIMNALHFPEDNIVDQLAKLKKYQRKPIILVDQMGQCGRAVNRLHKHGFNQVYILSGGLRTWVDAGLPLKKS